LRKDPGRRLHDIADALIEIDEGTQPVSSANTLSESASRMRATRRERLAWIVAGALTVALIIVALGSRRAAPASSLDTVEFTIDRPWQQFALSPDGRHVVFTATATTSSQTMLWVRSLDTPEMRVLSGTEGAAFPFWKPDSQAIGFFADGLVKAVASSGGRPISLCKGIGQGTWNKDDVILFGGSLTGVGGTALHRVSSRGGTPLALTSLVGDEWAHGFPTFLPGGEEFLYLAQRSDGSELRVGSLVKGESRSLGSFESHAEYASGYLFSVRGGSLTAQTFDPRTHQLSGARSVIAANTGQVDVRGSFSVSTTGKLTYSAWHGPSRTLTWVDRQGQTLSTVGESGGFINLDLSPDQQHLAVSKFSQPPGGRSQFDLWRLDLARSGLTTRLTDDQGMEWDPDWSPEGTQIAFTHAGSQGSNAGLFIRSADASGPNTLLVDSGNIYQPDWSHDGRFIIYSRSRSAGSRDGSDLWTLSMTDGRTRVPYLQTPHNEWAASFSPDDQWVAFSSDRTGRTEVYVRPFPVRAGEFPISSDGRESPRWRADGKEIFFLAPDGAMMSVTVETTGDFTAGVPHTLFDRHIVGRNRSYVVANDGQRFLSSIPDPPEPIVVLLNWPARLAK
jgi:Tol biopolymer transport system component